MAFVEIAQAIEKAKLVVNELEGKFEQANNVLTQLQKRHAGELVDAQRVLDEVNQEYHKAVDYVHSLMHELHEAMASTGFKPGVKNVVEQAQVDLKSLYQAGMKLRGKF
jgi:hypothetical protein